MRWNCTVECRPYGSVGKYYERITVIVWSLQRSQAVARAISGAATAGWDVARVAYCEPILAEEQDHGARIAELEAAVRAFGGTP